MEIKNKRVMVLGGWGLVGNAICTQLLQEEPNEIIILSLSEEEARDACSNLAPLASKETKLTPYWGNIFVRDSMKGLNRLEILTNDQFRNWLIDDTMEELSEELLQRSHLFQTINKFKPDVMIDCINSATAVAYQNIFKSYYNLKAELNDRKDKKDYSNEFMVEVEKLLCTQYIPQLIRHVQILYEAMRRYKTKFYLKIGTSGTGGMGLNIPYTHSEEKPSRTLLGKSTVAGAHSMLLFLMARTPDAPITKEIKPTAAIAWKRICYGEIRKGKNPVELHDCPLENAVELKESLDLKYTKNVVSLGENLKSVYVDTGENGIFSYGEFTAISGAAQMGLVTPEEIARSVIFEIKGGNTGHDIINALDNATMGPTYRAGLMRASALEKMRRLMEENKCHSVAFELLGPPRLSKLLYEAYLLTVVASSMQGIINASAEELSAKIQETVLTDQKLRASILSIGIPILLSDGVRLLRGRQIKVPSIKGTSVLKLSPESIDLWASDGWVDLRVGNMEVWRKRIQEIFSKIEQIPAGDTSSRFEQDRNYWLDEEVLNIGKVVGWIFQHEDQGHRMKD